MQTDFGSEMIRLCVSNSLLWELGPGSLTIGGIRKAYPAIYVRQEYVNADFRHVVIKASTHRM